MIAGCRLKSHIARRFFTAVDADQNEDTWFLVSYDFTIRQRKGHDEENDDEPRRPICRNVDHIAWINVDCRGRKRQWPLDSN